MKHLKKFKIFENNSSEIIISDVIDMVQDIIDAGYDVQFQNTQGVRVSTDDIIENKTDYEFTSVLPGSKKKFYFKILIFSNKSETFEETNRVLRLLERTINHLKEEGVQMVDFKYPHVYTEEKNVLFDFGKPYGRSEFSASFEKVEDIKENKLLSDLINDDKVREMFTRNGISSVERVIIDDDDNVLIVDFEIPTDDFYGNVWSDSRLDDSLKSIKNQLGAEKYDLERIGRSLDYNVYFNW
jgi:hypothetical protein